MSKLKQQNVYGEELESCCVNPITGFFRDGFCHTDVTDRGIHTVCVELTWEFLEYSRLQGNDLIAPKPEFNFPGLKEEIIGAFVQADGLSLIKRVKRLSES